MIDTFDLLGPLPIGTTVLEASAGTGKTFTVGALVARYVAEGHCRLDEMLIITFGRAASQELRERVREQLVEASKWLRDPEHAPIDQQTLAAHLLAGSDDDRALRRRRITDALASFDSATIATTHQFCQVVLNSLGVAGDTDPHITLIEDLDELLVEVVDDIYLAWYGQLPDPPMTRDAMLALARKVFVDAHAEITPDTPPLGSASEERLRVAREVRQRMDHRKLQRGVMSFDDLLSRLARALDGVDSPAAERMAARWKVVLVDEFQDTDPVQWEVLQKAFGGRSTVVLIGDPKQAIYAFRGGDIESYLAAVESADDRRTLATNYRSDQPLVDALQVLTRGAALGHDSIVVQPVESARSGSRLSNAPVTAPIRLRVVDVEPLGDATLPSIGRIRERIADDLANDIAALLSSDATFGDEAPRPVGAGDVAILMHSLRQAAPIRAALEERGIPCVVADRASVLASEAAEHWLRLLEALDRQSPDRVRSVAVTPLFGRSATELVEGGDPLTDSLAEQVRDLLDLFRLRGIAAVHEALFNSGVAERVLRRPGGERLLTDLEHVGELLHDIAHGRGWGLPALLAWLREERRAALDFTGSTVTDRHRRLDTDAAAVQIVTIHASKGLQYPIVYLPHAFNRWIPDVESETALRHHVDGERCIDVGQPFEPAVVRRSRAEDAGEELRLTYVAMTRAQSQVVAWWGRGRDARNSGLSRLLLGRKPDEAQVPDALDTVPELDDALTRLGEWQRSGGLVVEHADSEYRAAPPVPVDTSALTTRPWSRTVDVEWRRTSYTGLLRAAEESGVTPISEPEVEGTIDETSPDELVVDATVVTQAPIAPMSELPAGAGFGSLIHAVLEHADPQANDLAAELHRVVSEQLRWWPVDATVDDLVEALLPVHDSPMGPMFDDRTLRDIGQADRLNELDFEIPLAGGDRRDGAVDVRLAVIADALRRHLPADDVLAGYADHLSGPLAEQALRGYLGGSIDAVMRIGTGDDQRFVVVDYKTNRLGVPEQPITALDYTPENMAASMEHAHYPLQALLYSVVVHRYLRWRVPGYDPARHLGGVAYLYVRGMVGSDTPMVDGMRCGVFAWRPTAALITDLSDALGAIDRTAGGAS